MKVVLLTNILNPFRIFFYDKLRDEYAHHNVDFRVLVMVPNEPGRTWQYDDFRRDYTTLMNGGLKKVSGIDVIINPGIGRVIKKMNPDVMVCAGSYMLPSVWAAIGLKKKCNYKVFYWSESHLNEKRSYGSLKLAVRSFFRNTVISRFDGFWYAGKMSKEFIDTYASEDSYYVFVPNLIDERAYYIASKYSEEQKKVIRKSYNVADDNVMFLTPARLSKEKGILEFLDIMNNVPSKNKVTIVMPGQGELKEEIEKKAKEYGIDLRLVGFKKQTDMIDLYGATDVFVLPSLSDPNPLSCIEACWSANPLIVSEHVGNNPEIITEGQNGYVISYKNSKKAVNDIEQMICSSDEWKKNAGLFSLKVAQEKFNSERVVARVAKETLAIWENVK